MKTSTYIYVLILFLASVTGCANPYIVDRGRDAADIFTVAGGLGGGAQVRIGPVAHGLAINMNYCGLQDGDSFCGVEEYDDEHGVDGSFILYTFSSGNTSPIVRQRNKYYSGFHLLGIATPYTLSCNGTEYPPSYFTQMELIVGLGATLKLGFNPGELVDFVLGWTTLDIYNDDLARRPENNLLGTRDGL